MTKSKFYIGTIYDGGKPGDANETQPSFRSTMLSIAQPQQGMDASSYGYAEVLDFEYGGSDVIESAQTHRRYEFNWSGSDVEGISGIDQMKRLANGEFGTKSMIYFADPYNYTTNLMPPQWATPILVERGWRNIYDTMPTSYVSTMPVNPASEMGNLPTLSPVWTISGPANSVPVDKRGVLTLPVPPDFNLNVGFTGEATGTAVVRARPILVNGNYGTTVDLDLLDYQDFPKLNAVFSGAAYRAVEFYFTRTSSAASTLRITGAMAQLHQGAAPSVNVFIGGQGNTGCRFETRAIEETYTFVDMGKSRRIKGLSASLIEVGTSSRYA